MSLDRILKKFRKVLSLLQFEKDLDKFFKNPNKLRQDVRKF